MRKALEKRFNEALGTEYSLIGCTAVLKTLKVDYAEWRCWRLQRRTEDAFERVRCMAKYLSGLQSFTDGRT